MSGHRANNLLVFRSPRSQSACSQVSAVIF